MFIFPVWNILCNDINSSRLSSCFTLKDTHISPSDFFVLNSLKALLCNRFICRCSGCLKIMGKTWFCNVWQFGGHFGSCGSSLMVTFICSILLISIDYSIGGWGFAMLDVAPFPPKSPEIWWGQWVSVGCQYFKVSGFLIQRKTFLPCFQGQMEPHMQNMPHF